MTTLPTNHPLYRGIETLRAWFEAHKTNANRFAIQNGIDPSVLGKLMRGVTQRMSMDLANKIDRGTRGEVPYGIWLEHGVDTDPAALVKEE